MNEVESHNILSGSLLHLAKCAFGTNSNSILDYRCQIISNMFCPDSIVNKRFGYVLDRMFTKFQSFLNKSPNRFVLIRFEGNFFDSYSLF